MPKDKWGPKLKPHKKDYITFGKYAGTPIKDLPLDYLEWLLKSGAGLAWESLINKTILKLSRAKKK